LRTPKTSSGSTSIFMSCLTLTWQDRRQPRGPRRGDVPVSVGSIVPPPSLTITLQTPQVPLPPQAEGMKILLSASVLQQLAAGRATVTARARVVVDVDRDVAAAHQLRALASRMSTARASTMAGEHPTPRMNDVYHHRWCVPGLLA
jgi:hypothetical protein